MSSRTIRLFCTGLLSIALAACGGGGSSASTAPSSASGSPAPAPAPSPGTGQSSPPGGSTSPGTPSPGTSTPPAPGTATPPSTADATLARFNAPRGIARAANGDLYVVDGLNFTIRRIAANGVVTTLAGMPGTSGSADGAGSVARFTEPRGIALDAAGNLWVTDGSTVRRVTPAGVVSTVAGQQGAVGNVDSAGSAARFHKPDGIVVDAAGNVYVADPDVDALRVRRIDASGVVTTVAGRDRELGAPFLADGSGTEARFVGPTALALDAAGNLWVADVVSGSFTGPKLWDGVAYLRRIAPDRSVRTVAGNGGYTTIPAIPYQPSELAQFVSPSALAIDAAGNVYVADHFDNGNRLLKVTPGGAVSGVPLAATAFGHLRGLLLTDTGFLASDDRDSTIDRIAADGSVTVVAGRRGSSGTADTP